MAWCGREWFRYEDTDITDNELEVAIQIATEIEMEWDIYIGSCYTRKELSSLDFTQVTLPKSYFVKWLEDLNNLK